MKLPTRLNILGNHWRLKVKPLAECPDFRGKALFRSHVIEITDDNAKLCTVIHEIFEILNDSFELELPHTTITALETGMFAVLKGNPRLTKLFL